MVSATGAVTSRRFALALAPLVLLGCGTSNVDPTQQLKDAAVALKAIKTVQMDLKFGPGATVTASGFTVTLVTATGKVRLPSDSQLDAKVQQGGNVVQIQLVSLDGVTYFKPISFLPAQQLSADEAKKYPTAARLTDADTGLASILPKGQNPKASGSESVDGHDCNKVEADYRPEDINTVFTPFVALNPAHAVLWIGKDDHLVRKAHISGKLFDASTDSFIEVHLHDFNANVDIVRPS